MSSNLIYAPSAARIIASLQPHQHSAGDRTPYCYLIGWSKLNLWYYGRRTAKGCHPNEFWVTYFTSSRGPKRRSGKHSVESCVAENGPPDFIQIRKIFGSVELCKDWENRVLLRLRPTKTTQYINRSNGDTRFDGTNKVVVRDADYNLFQVELDDPDFISGKLVIASKGMSYYRDINNPNGPLIYAATDDPRRLSGELISGGLGYGVYRDTDGTVARLSINDPRVVSKEVTSVNARKSIFKDSAGDVVALFVDDPRVLSGEVSGVCSGTVVVVDRSNNCFRVSLDDPRYISGELVAVSKGTVVCFDSLGNRITVSIDDPRYISGEIKSVFTGTILYADSSGKKYRKLPTDPDVERLGLTPVDIAEHRNQLKSRLEVSILRKLAKSRGISIPASANWTLDLLPWWDIVLRSPRGTKHGVRSGPYSTSEKNSRKAHQDAQRQRPDVLYLKNVANSKNIKLKPYWEWANDLTPYRDAILNGPSNVSYVANMPKRID